MGWIEHLNGNHAEALRLLNEALPALSQIPQVHYHLGRVYEALGNGRWTGYHMAQAATGPQDVPEVQRARTWLADR